MEQIHSRNAVALLVHGQSFVKYYTEVFGTVSGRYIMIAYFELEVFHMRDKVWFCDNKKFRLVVVYLQFVD